MSGMATTLAH
jgi:hypothetical protein